MDYNVSATCAAISIQLIDGCNERLLAESIQQRSKILCCEIFRKFIAGICWKS